MLSRVIWYAYRLLLPAVLCGCVAALTDTFTLSQHWPLPYGALCVTIVAITIFCCLELSRDELARTDPSAIGYISGTVFMLEFMAAYLGFRLFWEQPSRASIQTVLVVIPAAVAWGMIMHLLYRPSRM